MGLPACEGITAGKASGLPHVLVLRIPIIAVYRLEVAGFMRLPSEGSPSAATAR